MVGALRVFRARCAAGAGRRLVLLPRRYFSTQLKSLLLSNISTSIDELSPDPKRHFSDIFTNASTHNTIDEKTVVQQAKKITESSIEGFDTSLVDVVLNTMLFNIKIHGDVPEMDSLLYLAEILSIVNPDFRTMINYKLLLDELESVNYYEQMKERHGRRIAIWEFFNVNFRPFLTVKKLENYNQKMTYLLDFMRYIEHTYSEEKEFDDGVQNVKVFQKLLYPILVDMIRDSILVSDVEFARELLAIYENQYLNSSSTNTIPLFEKIPSEDYHTLVYSAIEVPNKEILKLITSEKFTPALNISESERQKLLVLLARYGLISEYLRVLNTSFINLTGADASLIIQLFFDDLGVHESFKLLDHIVKLQKVINWSYRDFLFITQFLNKEIIDMSITRKDFKPRDPSSLSRNLKLSIQRVDISNQLEKYRDIIESEEFELPVKRLLLCCLMKSISEIGNATGLIHQYLSIPTQLHERALFEIFIHGLTRGDFDTHLLRVSEVWNYSRRKDMMSLNSLEFCVEFGLKGIEPIGRVDNPKICESYANDFMFEVLDQVFLTNNVLSNKIIYLLIKKHNLIRESKRVTQVNSFEKLLSEMDPQQSYSEISDYFKLQTSSKPICPSLTDVKFNKHDIKESKTLERYHAET